MEKTYDLHAEVGYLKAKIENVDSDISEIKTDVKDIKHTLSNLKGNWRGVFWIMGALATFSGVLVAFWKGLFNAG